MSYFVSPTDVEQFGLGKLEGVEDVLRNIAVILATPLGSVPLYRDFGLDQSFLDKPESEALNCLTSPVREAIERWEPRAEFVELTVTKDLSDPGKVVPIVEVEISLD